MSIVIGEVHGGVHINMGAKAKQPARETDCSKCKYGYTIPKGGQVTTVKNGKVFNLYGESTTCKNDTDAKHISMIGGDFICSAFVPKEGGTR